MLVRYLADNEEPVQKMSSSYQIFGCSLAGFGIDDHEQSPPRTASGYRYNNSQNEYKRRAGPYDLEDQICFVQGKLADLVDDNIGKADQGLSTALRQKVILIGHSGGSYIAMEILRRHREAESKINSSQSIRLGFDIVGGIMLFPTVLDIGASPSGRKLTVQLHSILHFKLPDSHLGYSRSSYGLSLDWPLLQVPSLDA
jgi:pimeloyl-ACP methyl ester carboxylesterase